MCITLSSIIFYCPHRQLRNLTRPMSGVIEDTIQWGQEPKPQEWIQTTTFVPGTSNDSPVHIWPIYRWICMSDQLQVDSWIEWTHYKALCTHFGTYKKHLYELECHSQQCKPHGSLMRPRLNSLNPDFHLDLHKISHTHTHALMNMGPYHTINLLFSFLTHTTSFLLVAW